MPYNKIKRESAPNLVVRQLLDMIHGREIQPGDPLPAQRELAKLLGVGRSSVREAINALSVMGYLDVAQGKGTFVRREYPSTEISLTRIHGALRAGGLIDLLEIRETIECKSAELAAERVTPQLLRKMKSALSRMETEKGDYARFLDADMRFHSIVAEATQNKVIREITHLMLENLAGLHRNLETSRLPPHYHDRSIESARELIASIEKGDGKSASSHMMRHINEIRQELKEVLK